ncbi:MAG: AraC family transcriptional regulator [Wenzhouxiangellaceae bacterium]|nr:MAG: AraC family transcriptional regulator [Wenzhouxiangellaceae bacterium]
MTSFSHLVPNSHANTTRTAISAVNELASIPVPAVYLASYLEHTALDHRQLAAILERARIDIATLSGEQARISLSELLETLALIDQLSPPGWHIQPTLRLEATHHGPLGLAVVTATDLGAAIDCLVRFESLRSPWTVLQASHTKAPAGLRLRVLPTLALPAPGELLMEMNLIALVKLLAELGGRHRDQLSIDLPARYRPWAGQLLHALPGHVRLDQQHYQIWVPKSLLGLPCLLADASLHASTLKRCEQLLGQDCGTGPISARVQQQLMALNGRDPGLSTMAFRLGMSRRTLIRRLESEQRSYRQLVDRVRLTLARDWLQRTDMPISRIAELLGYGDTANFGRAFRRWTGSSPGALRRR